MIRRGRGFSRWCGKHGSIRVRQAMIIMAIVVGDPSHTVLAGQLQEYLRWRNADARHPDALAAQRRERARIRSERPQRWGRPKTEGV